MATFAITAYDVPTDAAADQFAELLGLKAGDTAGHRGRLRSITVGGAGGAAQDVQVTLRLVTSNNTTDGTSTAVVPTKLDPDTIASRMTGKKNYTAPPTTIASTFLWEGALNSRGSLIKEWLPGEGPMWGKNQTLLLLAAPGAATAETLTVSLEWDE